MMYERGPYHTAVYGHYVNNRDEKKRIYLGFSFNRRVNQYT